jgi:tetratricopeptide (TPR) repeat protein
LAQKLYFAGKYDEAEPLFVEALAQIETKLGRDNPRVEVPLNNLAYNYLALRKYAAAEEAFRRVLALREAGSVAKPSHGLASALNSLGAALSAAGKFVEAEKMLLAGLAMREQVLGLEHDDVAISLTALGKLYIATGRYEQADKALARALAIVESASGKDHSDVAAILHEQGRSQQKQGRTDQAEQLLQRALAIRLRKRPGHPDTVDTASVLAALYRLAGNGAAAKQVELEMAATARRLAIPDTAALPAG